MYDIKRFIDKNMACIQEAPLQVHYSALIFAPKESIVRKQFEDCMPPWICQRPKVEKNWGDLLQTFEGPSSTFGRNINAVAFSPDGNQLASAWDNGTVRVWDPKTGAVRLLQGHEGRVLAIAFSQDGKQLASASRDKTVRLWDLTSTDPEVKLLKGLEDSVYSMRFAQDGKQLASLSGKLKLWDLTELTSDYDVKMTVFEDNDIDKLGGQYFHKPLAFSQDGRWLASVLHGMFTLWDFTSQPVKKSSLQYERNGAYHTFIAFSQNGRWLVSALKSSPTHGILMLWDLISNPIERKQLEINTGKVTAMAFSQNDEQLAIASNDRMIEIWDLTSNKPVKKGKPLKDPTSDIAAVAFSQDGKQLASGAYGGIIRLWDLSHLTSDPDVEVKSPKGDHHVIKGWVHELVFTQNGKQLVSVWSDGTLRLLDSERGVNKNNINNNVIGPLKSNGNHCRGWAISQITKQLALRFREPAITLWDLTSDPIEKRELLVSYREDDMDSVNTTIAISQNGRQLALLTRLQSNSKIFWAVTLWDLTSKTDKKGKHFEVVPGCYSIDPSLVLAQDGKKLALYSLFDDSIVLCDLTSNPVKQTIILTEGLKDLGSIEVVFSQDSKQLASVSMSGWVRLWDLTSNPVKPKTLGRHEGEVSAMAFSQNGKQLASASSRETLKLWDLTDLTDLTSDDLEKAELFQIDAPIIKYLSFSSTGTGTYLQTNRGQLSLPLNAAHDSSNVPTSVFVKRKWVSRDGEDILWLPVEHRSKLIAIHGSKIGYLFQSEQPSIIGFDFSKATMDFQLE